MLKFATAPVNQNPHKSLAICTKPISHIPPQNQKKEIRHLLPFIYEYLNKSLYFINEDTGVKCDLDMML